MYKDTTYKEKFAILKPWMPTIIETIKKDLKTEHLKRDNVFLKTYFPSKNPNKLTTEEMVKAYSHAVANADNGENLGEFLTNRWLLKNGDIYHYFEQELNAIAPNFTELSEIDKSKALPLMQHSVDKFGALATYLFSVLNSVVFPDEVYQALRQKAEAEVETEERNELLEKEKQADEDMQKAHAREIARLTDKYEKKLAGLQKKYVQDMDALKKQISALQRRLDGKTA
jgi:hypothetical protein